MNICLGVMCVLSWYGGSVRRGCAKELTSLNMVIRFVSIFPSSVLFNSGFIAFVFIRSKICVNSLYAMGLLLIMYYSGIFMSFPSNSFSVIRGILLENFINIFSCLLFLVNLDK